MEEEKYVFSESLKRSPALRDLQSRSPIIGFLIRTLISLKRIANPWIRIPDYKSGIAQSAVKVQLQTLSISIDSLQGRIEKVVTVFASQTRLQWKYFFVHHFERREKSQS